MHPRGGTILISKLTCGRHDLFHNSFEATNIVKMASHLVNVFLLFLIVYFCVSDIVKPKDNTTKCDEVPDHVLEKIMGAAYNSRYMSITIPFYVEESPNKSVKRGTYIEEDFAVEEHYAVELEDIPAWEMNHVSEPKKRIKRDINFLREWHCDQKVHWVDLGRSYFPRYIRHVECSSKYCWFNVFRCKARSFTVKVLRRRQDKCVIVDPGNLVSYVGTAGLPHDLKEMWVWEERAVSFCCECVIDQTDKAGSA